MTDHEGADWLVATLAIHVGLEPDPATGATLPPTHPTSTHTQ